MNKKSTAAAAARPQLTCHSRKERPLKGDKRIYYKSTDFVVSHFVSIFYLFILFKYKFIFCLYNITRRINIFHFIYYIFVFHIFIILCKIVFKISHNKEL